MQAEAEARKAEINKKYTPHGAIRELWRCKDKEILVEGPAGTGKTRGILEKLNLACMKYPGIRCLIIRKTKASLAESVLATFENNVLPADSPLLYGPLRANKQYYKYPNGSRIVLGGMDKATRIMSTDFDMLAVFEGTEITENDWESLQTRLRNNKMPYQQGLIDCNPSSPSHWLNQRALNNKITRFSSTHQDNPTLTDEYIKTLQSLSGHRYRRLFLGEWSAAEGLVYPGIQNCFVPHFKPPLGRLYGAIDWGWQDPFAALAGVYYVTESGEDLLYVYYERYKSKTPLAVHTASLKRVFPEGYGVWFADPSQPENIRSMRNEDLNIKPARNKILPGIDAVNARIQSGRLIISDRCTALRAEITNLVYKDEQGDKPVDKNNHACDALRYLVLGIDWQKLATVFDVTEEVEIESKQS